MGLGSLKIPKCHIIGLIQFFKYSITVILFNCFYLFTFFQHFYLFISFFIHFSSFYLFLCIFQNILLLTYYISVFYLFWFFTNYSTTMQLVLFLYIPSIMKIFLWVINSYTYLLIFQLITFWTVECANFKIYLNLVIISRYVNPTIEIYLLYFGFVF